MPNYMSYKKDGSLAYAGPDIYAAERAKTDDHTSLLVECERAIAMARATVPMTRQSEAVWESLHKRVCGALGMPWNEQMAKLHNSNGQI